LLVPHVHRYGKEMPSTPPAPGPGQVAAYRPWPALMGKHNFNIVIPLFDWMFGALLQHGPEKPR
jgi:hypothetical protein